MKKIFAILLLVLVLHLSAIPVFSVDIDGYDSGIEWAGAETIFLLNGESNCKVNFGLVKWRIEPNANSVYFCVLFKEPDLSEDNKNVGASIKIESSDFYTVSVSSSTNEIDEDKYSFEGAVSIDPNYGTTCEMRFGLKYGIPDIINGSVRFYDSDGVPSNIYDFTIHNTEKVTEEHKNYNSGGSNQTSSDKTITQNVEKTTKKAEKTTKRKTSDSGDDLWLFDIFFSNITTKQETTSVTTQTKSETKKKTQKKNKTAAENQKSSVSETIFETVQEITESTQYCSAGNFAIKSSLGLEKGDKYKTITLITGAVTLVAISVLGTMKSRKEEKSSEKENDPKS